MNFLLDENFGLHWVPVLEEQGWTAIPWVNVGAKGAEDEEEVMAWARTNDYIVLTKDLDFGFMLYLTRAEKPSVVLVRASDPSPEAIGRDLTWAIKRSEFLLEIGALVVFDDHKHRVRALPLG